MPLGYCGSIRVSKRHRRKCTELDFGGVLFLSQLSDRVVELKISGALRAGNSHVKRTGETLILSVGWTAWLRVPGGWVAPWVSPEFPCCGGLESLGVGI